MAKRFRITREKYRKIKRYNHNDMENYLISVYYSAYQAGKEEGERAAVSKVKLSDIEIAVTNIKGIGIKKSAEIMTAISGLYKEGQEHAG